MSIVTRSLVWVAIASCAAFAQGPVTLMGIDAEDGNGAFGSSHGGKAPYIAVLTSMLGNTTNGGSGVLVIGGGKNPNDDVTGFFNAICAGATPAQVPTYVNGAAAITAQSFAGFRVIAVVSSQFATFSGGLTQAENDALAARAAGIAAFVNGGGGLLGFSADDLTNPYGYLGTIGAFTFGFPAQYDNVTATAAGLAVGITNTNLDVCCWHDEYTAFPAFLQVLATNNNTGNAAAIGGASVVIVQGIALTPPNQVCNTGQPHTVTATVATNQGNPVVGTLVTFTVVSGPNAGQMGQAMTNAMGQATFTYIGGINVGIDTIQACFVDAQMVQRCAMANKEWVECLVLLGFRTANIALNPWPTDRLLVEPEIWLSTTMEVAPWFTIPNDPIFQGFTFYAQVGMFNPAVFPSDPLQMSHGMAVTVGQGVTNYGVGGSGITGWPSGPVDLGSTFRFFFSIPGL